jgi:pimeloyl-ACP methyl ester carboxylesterase
VREIRVLELAADRRELAWTEFGVPGGVPIVAFHGSPGSGYDFGGVSDTAAGKGVRLIAVDRPGYGLSTFDPARSYESGTRDIGELADHLGLDRFAVIGHSSGGPNAAACARFLSDRLTGCAIVSGPAPPEAEISKREVMRQNRIAQRLQVMAPRLMSAAWRAGLRQAQRAPDKALAYLRRTLPASDVAVIERPDIAAGLRAAFARPVSRTAGRAAVQDIQVEHRPWGYRLGDVAMSVQVWHGDADRNVVVANGRYQATEIPGSTLHEMHGEGHWLIYSRFDEILDSVTA